MSFATDDEIRIAHDILLKGKKPFDNQRVNIIKEDNSCYVQACPGSGKTTALLAKLIILANRMPLPGGKGVCVLTHTNVAIDEIKAKLGQKANMLFKYPNFFGTIQTFMHKYVTSAALHYFYGSPITYVDDDVANAVLLKKYSKLAFGNKLKGLVYAHTIVKEHTIEENEINEWGGVNIMTAAKVIKKKGKRVVKYDFQLKDYNFENIPENIKTSICSKRDNILDCQGKDIILSFKVDWQNHQIFTDQGIIRFASPAGTEFVRLKEEMFREGILSYDDAYDLAFRYINHKGLDFSSFSDKRFQYLFVDEVQDCDSQQVELINKIFADDKVVIQRFGDYCQAIFDGYTTNGAESDELKGDNVLYIHDSNRFGERIAKPLRTLCPEDNQLLEGNEDIPSVKPIIISYEDPLSVLPKFEELLRSTLIPEKDNLSVFEIANQERKEDPLHRVNVKACGWVGRKVAANEQKRYISSYFPAFEKKKVRTKTEGNSFDDFIPKSPNESAKDYATSILQGILKFLDLCDVKNENRRFTRKTLLDFIEQNDSEKKVEFLSKIMNWAMLVYKSNYDEYLCDIKDGIYHYITESLLPMWGKCPTVDANSFFNSSLRLAQGDLADGHGNTYHGNGIDIEIATVHAVKGETHASTLYMETFFQGHYESERLSSQFKGVAYSGLDKNALMSLRVMYVGMSRPRYLLCVAIQKDRFHIIDCPELREIWDVAEA